MQEILQNFWTETNVTPSFSEYEPFVRGELLRLVGFYLTFNGRSRGIKDCQANAKDVITNAITIFESIELVDKVAEAKIILAFCYWNTGEVDDCNALLSLVETEFSENKIHPVYLQLQINRLLCLEWDRQYKKALKLVNDISGSVEFCNDLRLRAMFHSEAGIICRRNEKFDDAAFHHKEAVRLSAKSGNFRFVAANYNGLALLYRSQGDFPQAHKYAAKSLKLYSDLNDEGWIPHVLDTIALIYIEEKNISQALSSIEKALKYFYANEDYDGLTNALWTKTLCLLRLNREEEAFLFYGELHSIARERIGETATRKYAKNLSEEIYPLQHLSLPDDLAAFKKSRIKNALKQAGGVITKAAQILKLEKHQTLSNALKNQFPSLRTELGFEARAPRGMKEKLEELEKTIILKPEDIREEKIYQPIENKGKISQIVLTNKQLLFDFYLGDTPFETFYFDKYLMRLYGCDYGAVVAITPVSKIKSGMSVVVNVDGELTVGRLEYHEWAKIFVIKDEYGEPGPFDETTVVGEPIASCPISQVDNETLEFSRLEIKD